jgi:hypothetical protein
VRRVGVEMKEECEWGWIGREESGKGGSKRPMIENEKKKCE